MEKPLVSIMIPVHNNAQTLARCLESLLEQDYDNLQLGAMDNHSTDESYEILVGFEREYRDRLYIGRTFNTRSNSELRMRCAGLTNPRTRFLMFMSPTDTAASSWVSRSMELFTESERIGCVVSHADIVLPSGQKRKTAKYRENSCVIPGHEQMESYMSRGIDLGGLPLFRTETLSLAHSEGFCFNRHPEWLPLVMAATISDLGYISEPLVFRGDSRSLLGDEFVPSLEDFFEHYLFLQTFHDIAIRLERFRVSDLLPVAVQRLSLDCVRCASTLVETGELRGASAYLSLALAYCPETVESSIYKDVAALLGHNSREQS